MIKDLRFRSGKAGMSLKDTAMVYHVPGSGFDALPHKGKKEIEKYIYNNLYQTLASSPFMCQNKLC